MQNNDELCIVTAMHHGVDTKLYSCENFQIRVV